MGRIILVTGGARSGKSTYAENRVRELAAGIAAQGNGDSNVMYIATSIPFDDEMKERVRLHKERRPQNWKTFEGYSNLSAVYENGDVFDVILLDCITVMITNLMFEQTGEDVDSMSGEQILALEQHIFREISDFVEAAKGHWQDVVIVTNEVGLGLVPEYKLGRIFRDVAGRMNQYIAANADEVYMAVCGIPVKIK